LEKTKAKLVLFMPEERDQIQKRAEKIVKMCLNSKKRMYYEGVTPFFHDSLKILQRH
jgi:hypothetical protein